LTVHDPCVTGKAFVAGLAGVLVTAVTLTGSARASLNLHRVDWGDVTLPASVCGMRNGPIHLHDYVAYGPSYRWSGQWLVEIDAGWNPVVYGNLGPHGTEAAALVVDCTNGGGTAGSVLAYAQVVFTSVGNSLRVVGVLRPQKQPHGQMPTLLTVTIRPGEVVAHEAFYGGMDATCCPSGRATTVWRYTSGRLVAGRPTVTRAPHP
jgi:hypothetical protein